MSASTTAWEAVDNYEAADPVLLTVALALLHVTGDMGIELALAADVLCESVHPYDSFAQWFSRLTLAQQGTVKACLDLYYRTARVEGLFRVEAAFAAIDTYLAAQKMPPCVLDNCPPL